MTLLSLCKNEATILAQALRYLVGMSPRVFGLTTEKIVTEVSHLQAVGGNLPEYVPLPSAKGAEFFTGLKRGSLNQLILPCKGNNYKPPVKSISLRRPGQSKGKRLILLRSLLDYLHKLLTEQSAVT